MAEPAAKPARRSLVTRVLLSLLVAGAVTAQVLIWRAGRKPAVVPAASLQMAAVDDGLHLFDHVEVKDVPPDIEIRVEDVPIGRDGRGHVRTARQRYAFAFVRHGESAAQTRARLLHWLAGYRLPGGERFAVEDVYGSSPDDGHPVRNGARSLVLEEPPVITSADVTRVLVLPDDHDKSGHRTCIVDISFTRRGARLLLDATRRLVERRMAIAVGGVVKSAALVAAPIPDGHMVVSTPGAAEYSCAEARQLRASLLRKPGAD